AQTPLLLLTQLTPRLAQRQQRHRGIAAAAGFAMATHPHQRKPALLPETPKLVGIAETHREIILTTRMVDQCLADTFPLAMGMNRNAGHSSPFERRRQRRTAVCRQRLRHQVTARTPKACPYCPAKFRA